jgi:uncharacterized protein
MSTTLNAPPATTPSHRPNWLRHARNACLRVPPLWPLHSFVAVNPFLGLTGRPFADVCGLMQRVTHESMLMSADYFRQQHASGRITSRDLLTAIVQSGSEVSPDDLLAWLDHPEPDSPAITSSLADIATARIGGFWSRQVTEEISKWCAAYFDEGQSAWRLPWKKQALFAAWRQTAMIDGTPELNGLKGFRKLVASLPEDATDSLNTLMGMLGVPTLHAEDYLHRLLMTLPGWSSYVQYRVRDKAMHGKQDESLIDLLAVRLVFEVQLANQFEAEDFRDHWLKSLDQNGAPKLEKQLLWHTALELGFQRELHSQIKAAAAGRKATPRTRPAVQSVFCIDVRSEVMRRSLEASSPDIETLGFAGFFGMPIEYVPFGRRHGTSQVPVLFSPKYRVRGHLPNANEQQEKDARRNLQIGRRTDHSLSAFKTSAVSCFSFVEAAGVGFAWKLLKDSFQIGAKPESKSCTSCLTPNLHHPEHSISKTPDDLSPEAGIPPEDQVQLALGALKNMGLTSVFARLVMLCGHGSHTTNNPYAAGLDCGACGGHAGDSNARVAAAILNQPDVRAALKTQGIHIPDDTHFIAALHTTTTDEITLFDADKVPSTHETDLMQFKLWLNEASNRSRQQRAASLGLAGASESELDHLIHQRSRDWSQTRPEWGLAGNAAFIAAPRERTRQLDLKGRVFLHNYRHSDDTTQSTLELIMTAPMVVANWINLQYYASTVNNRLWGSGNKVMHNVVGTFGIQQGNGGDLQAGLPLQSVHNGEKWMHEPLRLGVFIEAPLSDIDAVIERHESVRQLVENGWLHLFAIEDEGRVIQKRESHGQWLPV